MTTFLYIILLKDKSEKLKKMVFQVFQSENFEEKKNSFLPHFLKNGVYIHDCVTPNF